MPPQVQGPVEAVANWDPAPKQPSRASGEPWVLQITVTLELITRQSLMNFILPEQFARNMESLRTIFKSKGDAKVTMLAKERVSRAKKMMTPFVLRRRKDQVYGSTYDTTWF